MKLQPKALAAGAVAFLAGVLFLFQLGGPLGHDACLYAVLARQIVRTGEWATLHYPYFPDWANYSQHPPLTLWMTAALYKVLGVGEVTARLVCALSGVAAVLAAYALGAAVFGRAAALTGAAGLLLTEYFVREGRGGMLDMPLTAWTTLSLLGWVRGKARPGWYALFGLAGGAAILSKGVAGFMPLLAAALAAAISRSPSRLADRRMWGGVLLYVALPLTWVIPAWILNGGAPIQGYVVNQVLWQWYGGASRAAHPLWGYLREYAVYALPLSPFALWGAARFSLQAWRARDDQAALPVAAVLATLGAFGASGTVSRHNLIPAIPPSAVLVGAVVGRRLTERGERRLAGAMALGGAGVAAFLWLGPVNLGRLGNRAVAEVDPVKALAPELTRVVPHGAAVAVGGLEWWLAVHTFAFYLDRTVIATDENEVRIARLQQGRRDLVAPLPPHRPGEWKDVMIRLVTSGRAAAGYLPVADYERDARLRGRLRMVASAQGYGVVVRKE